MEIITITYIVLIILFLTSTGIGVYHLIRADIYLNNSSSWLTKREPIKWKPIYSLFIEKSKRYLFENPKDL